MNREDLQSKYIQGTYAGPGEFWENLTPVASRQIGTFSMRVSIKSDGRIHYTGIKAADRNGQTVFENQWGNGG